MSCHCNINWCKKTLIERKSNTLQIALIIFRLFTLVYLSYQHLIAGLVMFYIHYRNCHSRIYNYMLKRQSITCTACSVLCFLCVLQCSYKQRMLIAVACVFPIMSCVYKRKHEKTYSKRVHTPSTCLTRSYTHNFIHTAKCTTLHTHFTLTRLVTHKLTRFISALIQPADKVLSHTGAQSHIPSKFKNMSRSHTNQTDLTNPNTHACIKSLSTRVKLVWYTHVKPRQRYASTKISFTHSK